MYVCSLCSCAVNVVCQFMFWRLIGAFLVKLWACCSSRLFSCFIDVFSLFVLSCILHSILFTFSFFRFSSGTLIGRRFNLSSVCHLEDYYCHVGGVLSLPRPMPVKLVGRRLRLGVGLYLLSFQKISKIYRFLAICKSIICGLFVFLTLLWDYFQGSWKSVKNRHKPYVGLSSIDEPWSFSDRIFRD